MKTITSVSALALMLSVCSIAIAADDTRKFVQLPEMMQQHMMSNMRDHLATISEI